MWQAFQMQRKQDKALVPLMLAAVVGLTVVGWAVGAFLWGGWMLAITGFLFGVLLALFIFSRRIQKSVYSRVEGQPGAAGWALENLKSGVGLVWKTTTAVAGNQHMDLVHRTVGVCGVVLVGEGDPQRVKPLMAQQRKKLSRIAPGVAVYEFVAGSGEGQVPLRQLQKELMRLPRNMKKDEAYALAARLESIDKTLPQQQPIPKGPVPKGAKHG